MYKEIRDNTFSKMNCPKLFQTIIIDECHALRNLITYGTFACYLFQDDCLSACLLIVSNHMLLDHLSGGISAALLGIASGRIVPMTDTPFIDTTGDLAMLMVFIDPTMAAAHKKWWKEATKQESNKVTVDAVSSWKKYYLIRRDQEVLCDHLPKRTEDVRSVQCFEHELCVYKRYKQSFILMLEGYVNYSDPGLTLGKKDLMDILLLYLINMVCGL
jgi:hypothetical protein